MYSYVGYPVALALLSFVRSVTPRRDDSYRPVVSILIMAYNEEGCIREKIENAFETDYPKDKLEIIVASNGTTDRTDEIVREYEHRGVKLFSYKQAGKTNAENLTIPKARGEIIVLSDANSIYEKDAIKKMVSYFADERVGIVAGRLQYISSDTMTGKGESLYWNYDGFVKRLESKLGTTLVAHGGTMAFRKKLYEPINEALTEDFILPIRLIGKGYLHIFEPTAVIMEKAAEKGKEEYARKRRIVTQGARSFFTLLGELPLSKPLVLFELVSHKFLRWIVGVFMVGVLVSSLFLLSEGFYMTIFVLQIAFYLAAMGGYILEKSGMKVKLLYVPYFFCLVNAAAISGVASMLFGEKLSTWEKAKSAR
jgi:cellulose synthase/poly-beta-1,6-N-acetylglucosamine synthase-like glycosyltransferase